MLLEAVTTVSSPAEESEIIKNARALDAQSRDSEAVALVRDALVSRSESSALLMELARLLLGHAQFEDAVSAISRIPYEARSIECQRLQVRALIGANRAPEGLAAALRLGLHPTSDASDLILLANALERSGQLLAAIECYEQAASRGADRAGVANNIGVLNDELGRFDEALRCFELSLESEESPDVAYNAALTAEHAGLIVKAVRLYELAQKLYLGREQDDWTAEALTETQAGLTRLRELDSNF